MEACEKRPCTASDTAELKQVSQQLYGWLFPQPLQTELQTGKIQHLIFAPDRITRYLPMSALFNGNQYLIETYTVATIVSAEYTNTDRPNHDPKQVSILAAGLSNAAPPNFPPLSNVPLELAAIVQTETNRSGIYPGLELLNQKFDLLSLQKYLSSHTILHIATHGAFVRDQADASYILLGTGQKLPISAIKGLNDLGKIQLVVLSAGQTALADHDTSGIEITNVSFSFMERGVKAVIASPLAGQR
jgi:CHAT domain-containing protein